MGMTGRKYKKLVLFDELVFYSKNIVRLEVFSH